MKYRCPYCKAILDNPPPAKCPKCGHTMIPPPPESAIDRHAREKKIKAIIREAEVKKLELGLKAPNLPHGAAYYLAVIVILAIVTFFAFRFSSNPKPLRDAKLGNAIRNVDVLAEACGRFRFHTGAWPTADEGLAILASHAVTNAGWNGPYISRFCEDPWKHPYIYEPSTNAAAAPLILSLGPDGVRGTADDLTPNPDCFVRPGRDTSWTNGWVPYVNRGIIIVPSKRK